MSGDEQRERLREQVSLLATLVEGAYTVAITPPIAATMAGGWRTVTIQDALASLSAGMHADVMAYLACFRPVAADLRFATVVLGCVVDLRTAAAGIASVSGTLDGVDRPTTLPAISRLASLVHVVVCLMADAIVAWDVTAGDAARAAHREVALMREQMHVELTKALVQPEADIGTLLEIDAIGCLLERISSASGSCVRRLAKDNERARTPPTAKGARWPLRKTIVLNEG